MGERGRVGHCDSRINSFLSHNRNTAFVSERPAEAFSGQHRGNAAKGEREEESNTVFASASGSLEVVSSSDWK